MTQHICPRCGHRWDCGIDCGVKEIVGCGRTVCIGIADQLEAASDCTIQVFDYPVHIIRMVVTTDAAEQKIKFSRAGP